MTASGLGADEDARRVAIIGPGRAGSAVAGACVRAGMRVVAVTAPSAASQQRLTTAIAGVRGVSLESVPSVADLIVIAVPDRVLTQVADALAVAPGIGEQHRVIHLAGAYGAGPLRRVGLAGARIAACHPAMTLPAGITVTQAADLLIGAHWAVSVPDGADAQWASGLIRRLAGEPVVIAEQDRVRYHAALTVASNAVAAAVVTARQLLSSVGVDAVEPFLKPLVETSVRNVLEHGAVALTGPVVRGDADTVRRHLAALDRDVPTAADAYRHFARAILSHAQFMLEPAHVDEITAALITDGVTAPGG